MVQRRITGFIVCALFYVTYGSQILLVHNNGPSVLDGNITFYTSLDGSSSHGNLCFTFDDGIQKHEIRTQAMNMTFTTTFMSEKYKAGQYFMNCSVTNYETNETIGLNQTEFELKEYLIGNVIVNRDTEDLVDVDEVAVGENITMAVQFYDPNGYLTEAELNYMWSIDYEPVDFTWSNISYNYKDPEISRISTAVSAHLPSSVLKLGYFEKKLTVKVPVNSVNVSGTPFIHHGELLALNITCSGSPPFLYCARPLKPFEVADNFSCVLPVVSTTCSFQIKRYFQNYGTYHVGIFISNGVKTVKRVLEVVVYNVSKNPQLSTVIIPIVCSLLTLCIIVGGISYYIQQRNQLAIEVANFDFQEDSVDSHGVSTFFEKVFRSCSCRVCNYKGASCGDELFDDDEEEPLIYPEDSRRGYSHSSTRSFTDII